MAEAARLAREGVETGAGGPFGAVIVNDGNIVGASCNRVLATNDPTAHAEVEAIRQASRALDHFHLNGCKLYATCEPCPMCLAAIHWAHIEKVYYAMDRAAAAAAGFDDARILAAMRQPLVPFEQVASEAAADAFRLWREKEDRIQY